MKRFSLLLTVFSCLFLTGCEDTTVKAKTVEGVLLSVEEVDRKINQTYHWKKLNFKDGRSVVAFLGPGDSLYIGHYQEIELDGSGFIVDVKCKSFERLVANSDYQDYDPSLTQEREEELLSEKITREEFEIFVQKAGILEDVLSRAGVKLLYVEK